MISRFTCTACKTEVSKENGAQPGCPACGFGWATTPAIEPWPQDFSPWIIPYEPYVPNPTYPGTVPGWGDQPWYTIEWTSDGATITSTGIIYGDKENKSS